MAEANLSAERLRELLHYDPKTGVFTWIKTTSRRVKVGQRAGCVGRSRKNNYITIGVDGRAYQAHRLAWFYVYGEWPTKTLDHKSGDGVENWIDNLRDVTQRVNTQNYRKARVGSKSGLIGAQWACGVGGPNKQWVSVIRVDGKKMHLGYFFTAEDAHAAYIAAKRRLHEGCTL